MICLFMFLLGIIPFNVIGLCDAFNIYLGWKYFHPHSCRCHLANRDHCGNKILSLDFFQCFYPWWQVWWHPVFIYGDVYMYFSLNKAIYLSISTKLIKMSSFCQNIACGYRERAGVDLSDIYVWRMTDVDRHHVESCNTAGSYDDG